MWKEERGSIVVIVALAMTALMGLAALAIDVGRMYVERQRLSVVADAAALSGAQYLPHDQAGAAAAVQTYLQKNGVDPATATVSLAEDIRHISVGLSKKVPMTFARVLGFDEVAVTGSATSWAANLSGYYGVAPLGVPKADWKLGDQVILKLSPGIEGASSGNYQALALGKDGASTYEANLMYGYKQWLRAWEWVDTETGNMAQPTVRAVTYRINSDPDATYTTATRQSQRLVVVPILSDFNVNGSGQVQVVGFGVFFLEGANLDGNEKGAVIGRFVRLVAEGEGSESAPDFGAYTTKLTE